MAAQMHPLKTVGDILARESMRAALEVGYDRKKEIKHELTD